MSYADTPFFGGGNLTPLLKIAYSKPCNQGVYVCVLVEHICIKGWFGLVWFLCFNGISTLCRLFNAKAILLEEHLWYYLTHSWEDKGVHTFPKGICLKVNVIARLEYELAYYDSAVHRFNHYTTRTPLIKGWVCLYECVRANVTSMYTSMRTHNSIKRHSHWAMVMTWRSEFKSWTRLFIFHIILISLGKVCIQLFFFQQWINSRADWAL